MSPIPNSSHSRARVQTRAIFAFCADHARDFARGDMETYLIEKPHDLASRLWGPGVRTNATGAFSRAVLLSAPASARGFRRSRKRRCELSALEQEVMRTARRKNRRALILTR